MVENLAEDADNVLIFDREGRKYYLKVHENEDRITVDLIYRESKIGELEGAFYPDGEPCH